MLHRYRRLVAVLLQVLVFLAAPALAAPSHIRPELIAEGPALSGGEVTLAILMRTEAGWHGYWQNPGDAGQGMTVNWNLPQGLSAGAIEYPVPQTLLLSGLMNHVYEHDYAVLVRLKVPSGLAAGTRLPISAKAEWLACTDKICVPESGDLSAELVVGAPGQSDPRFDQWRQALPAPLGAKASFALNDKMLRLAVPLPASVQLEGPHLFLVNQGVIDYAAPQRFYRLADTLIIEADRAKILPEGANAVSAVLRLNKTGDGVSLEAAPGNVPTGGAPLSPDGPAVSLPWLLLSALLGGLLLNVMPCVFPILSLKALSLARAGESEAQARAEGWAYTAGVVLACLALGALLLVLRAAGEQVGWAFQLQEPLVVAGLTLLAVAITANLVGLFELTLPGLSAAGSPQGAFATGLLAAFAATPCTGPFMAAAMGAALLLPAWQAMALFGALGLGLAMPFLAIAEIPALRRMLPRPGAWMNKFRLAMALPMGLTAAALIWLASRLAGNGFAFALGLIGFILIAVLIVLGRRQRHGLAGGPMVALALAGLLAAATLGLPAMVRSPLPGEADMLGAQPFSEAALAKARASGRPVFVYFTADWCLTCKVNEKVALEHADTRYNFKRAGVVVLRGDWTRRDPAITRFLTVQGAAGVPLYLWYAPGSGQAQQLPQILTPALLGDLVRQTRTH